MFVILPLIALVSLIPLFITTFAVMIPGGILSIGTLVFIVFRLQFRAMSIVPIFGPIFFLISLFV